MKKNTNLFFCIIISTFLFSCKKENATPEGWQFTKLVNAVCDNSGNLMTLDFYQKKGTQWRIVRMSPDDYVTFYLQDTITPNSFELPADNTNAFMTSNVKLFNPADDKVYKASGLLWPLGDPIEFNAFNTFTFEFPDIPAAWNSINKISAATSSYEQAYDNNSKVSTYIFYDFPNQKYIYYAQKSGTDFVIDNNTLPNICTTCNAISWKNIDAATCTKTTTGSDTYYFFDFDGKKMYVLDRINKNTNNPSFNFDTGLVIDFSDAFSNTFGSNGGNELPFDFSR